MSKRDRHSDGVIVELIAQLQCSFSRKLASATMSLFPRFPGLHSRACE
jgi:hypothetical protein